MYKGKQAFTITAGVAALIREIERTDLIFGVSPSSAVTPAAEETVAQEQNAVIALEGQTEQNSDNDEVW